MQNQKVEKNELKLVGISVRTNNAKEFDPKTAKIAEIWGNFLSQNLHLKISNAKNMTEIVAVYCEYESDCNGDYTFFLGKEVTKFAEDSELLDGQKLFKNLVIPAQKYEKFTTDSGKMPEICINAWKKIWEIEQTSESVLYQKRAYLADFEVYDHRAMDPENSIVDIFIGIK